MNELWHLRRETASAYALYVAVAAMPFSILICHLAIVVFLVLWLFEKGLVERLVDLRNNYQLLALLVLGGLYLFAVSYSENKQEAWFAIEKKAFFFLLPIAFATSSIVTSAFSKNLFTLFCWSCFAALMICYIDAFQRVQLYQDGKLGTESINYLSSSDFWKGDIPKEWMFFSYLGLASAIDIHPTYLSMYAAFCCVSLVYHYLQGGTSSGRQVLGLTLILFFSFSIVLLSARIILIVLGITYVGMFLYQIFQTNGKATQAVSLLALILILFGGILINPVTRYRQVEEIALNGFSVSTHKNYTNSTGIRASLWWLSAKTYVNSNILFGVGTGDVVDSIKESARQYNVTNVLNSYSPHNQYLHILLATGLAGLSLWLIYLGAALVKAWQNRDIIFLNFLLLFMVVCITESVLELQKGIVFFSIFFSSMMFQKKHTELAENTVTLDSVASHIR